MTEAMRMNSTACIDSREAIQHLNLDLTELENFPLSSITEVIPYVNNEFSAPVKQINMQNRSIYSTEDTVIYNDIGLNKTIALEDLNWEVTHVSSHRINCNKNQFKVHYKKNKKKIYRP